MYGMLNIEHLFGCIFIAVLILLTGSVIAPRDSASPNDLRHLPLFAYARGVHKDLRVVR